MAVPLLVVTSTYTVALGSPTRWIIIGPLLGSQLLLLGTRNMITSSVSSQMTTRSWFEPPTVPPCAFLSRTQNSPFPWGRSRLRIGMEQIFVVSPGPNVSVCVVST